MHDLTAWAKLVSMHETRIIRPANPDMPPVVPFGQWTTGIDTGYVVDMAPRQEGKTPQRVVRVSDDLWERYGAACEAMGTSRSDDLRVHMSMVAANYEREQRKIARETAAATSES